MRRMDDVVNRVSEKMSLQSGFKGETLWTRWALMWSRVTVVCSMKGKGPGLTETFPTLLTCVRFLFGMNVSEAESKMTRK